MSIGIKIKNLRKKMGFTQNELASGIVSRSMLSLIESDSAMPSMQSLYLIAEKLSVSPSFLLEEGNDISNVELERIATVVKKEYQERNYKTVLGILEHSNLENDRRFSDIFTKCAFESAYSSFASGDFQSASLLLQKASDAVLNSLFIDKKALLRRIDFILEIINNIDNIEIAVENANDVFDFEFAPSLFFSLLKLLKNGKHDICNTLLAFCTLDNIYADYINAQMMIKDYKFIDAILLMKNISLKPDCPIFLKLLSYKSTEICCKLCEDFKGAYENRLAYQQLINDIKNRVL